MDDLTRRVNDSLALINEYLTATRGRAPVNSQLIDYAIDGVSTFALGGKHLRAALVHISAGELPAERQIIATTFGACVDLLHGAFNIHDDIIDRDDTRRGHPTVHAAVREEYADAHLGTSIGIAAGDIALNGALQILVTSPLDDALVRQAMRILTDAAQQTILGEVLDIAHTVGQAPDPALVRLSNDLKTSDYTFGAPLKLGALAAERDPASMGPIARELGRAFQAADDIAGSVGDSEATGKLAGGDVLHGRATLMTMRMGGDELDTDPLALGAIVHEVVEEGQAHLRLARTHIDEAVLSDSIRAGLHAVADDVERMLRTYA